MDSYSYHELEEIIEFIESLHQDAAQMRKLLNIANRAISLYRLKYEPEDLVHESIARCLEGTRRLPLQIEMLPALGKVIFSIAEGFNSKHSYMEENNFSSEFEEHEVENIRQVTNNDIVVELIAKETIQALYDYFKDDPEIMILLNSYTTGITRDSLISNYFNGNKTAYETAQRRFRRKIASFNKQEV